MKENTRRRELCFFSKKSTGDSLKVEQGSSQVNCAMFGQEGVRPEGRIVGSMTNKNIHNLTLRITFLYRGTWSAVIYWSNL